MIDPIRSYLLAAEGAADENMEEEDLEEKGDNEVIFIALDFTCLLSAHVLLY